MSITIVRDRICQHLRQCGFTPKDSARVASLIQKWVNQSGPEWTANRLKSLKQAHIDTINRPGEAYKVPLGWATRRNRKGVTILRDGFYHRVITHTGFSLIQVEAVMNLYKVIVLDKTSRVQEEKMFDSVTRQMSPDVQKSVSEWRRFLFDKTMKRIAPIGPVSMHIEKYSTDRRCGHMPYLFHYKVGKTKKVSPIPISPNRGIGGRPSLRTVKRSSDEFLDVSTMFQYDTNAQEFWRWHYYDMCCIFDKIFEYNVWQNVDNTWIKAENQSYIGKISVLQSAGAKARWIANPLPIWQAMGERLKRLLELACKNVDNIFTFDQDAGREFVAVQLSQGKTVYCYDSTAFTDRFPLVYQEEMLRVLNVPSFDSKVFQKVVKGVWSYDDRSGRRKDIRWEAGQPLGFGPSFHLATLTHALIVKRIEYECGVRGCSAVVGDDIVITDSRVAEIYEKFMVDSGVDINPSKSVISNKYGEFLGKLITSHGVIPSIKLALYSNADQIVSSLFYYGVSGWSHLKPSEKAQAISVMLPEPYGLGLKPTGMSYSRFLKLIKTDRLMCDLLATAFESYFTNFSVSDSDVQTHLSVRSRYYQINAQNPYNMGFDATGKRHVNELTCIPTSFSGARGHSDRFIQESVREASLASSISPLKQLSLAIDSAVFRELTESDPSTIPVSEEMRPYDAIASYRHSSSYRKPRRLTGKSIRKLSRWFLANLARVTFGNVYGYNDNNVSSLSPYILLTTYSGEENEVSKISKRNQYIAGAIRQEYARRKFEGLELESIESVPILQIQSEFDESGQAAIRADLLSRHGQPRESTESRSEPVLPRDRGTSQTRRL